MNDTLKEELEVFFEGLDAEAVTATFPDGSTRTFRAYFNAPFSLHQLGDGYALESAKNKLSCMTGDTDGFVKDETILNVAGTDYDIAEIMPDGTGMTVIELTDSNMVVGGVF